MGDQEDILEYGDEYEIKSYINSYLYNNNTEIIDMLTMILSHDRVINWDIAIEFMGEKIRNITSDEVMILFNLFISALTRLKIQSGPDVDKYPFYFISTLHGIQSLTGRFDYINDIDGNTLLIMLSELRPNQIDYDFLDEWFDPDLNTYNKTFEKLYNINYQNPRTGMTALHNAVLRNNEKLLNYLFINGAKPYMYYPTNQDLDNKLVELYDEYIHKLYNPETGTIYKELAERYKNVMPTNRFSFGRRSYW